jgi:succinoglycan biosynthesis transport protein ExoP
MESDRYFEMRSRENLARFAESPVSRSSLPAEKNLFFGWEQAVRVLRKNQRFLLVLTGILSLGIVTAALRMKDVYQPVARIEIDPLSSGIKTLQEIEDVKGTDNQDYLETQAQILQSEGLALRVIRTLHLDQNPEFVASRELEKHRKQQNQTASFTPRPDTESAFLQEQIELANRTAPESMALEVFKRNLAVNSVRNSRLVEVSYTSHDAQLAQLITNTLVTQFIDQNYRNRYTTTMQASEWLSTQLNDLRQKVEEANQAVTDYQKRFGLVEVDERDVPLGQLMSEVNHQLSDAQANRIQAEAYVRMIDLGQQDALPAVRDDQIYQNLMTHYADVRAQLAQARTIYGDENSNVKKLQDQSNELSAQIAAERARVVNQVRTFFSAARNREDMMLGARDKLKTQMGDATSHMVAFRVLRNEAMAKAELYNTLQARLKEAGIYAGLRSSNINVVDLAAQLTHASAPHRGFIIAVGVTFSFILAVILAFVRESLDNTVRTPDDVKEWTGLPSLAMLPRIHNGTEPEKNYVLPSTALGNVQNTAMLSPGVLLAHSHTPEAEAIQDLRTALLFSKPGPPARVILVSSSSAGEGKTTIAINLAIALAQRAKTCLVESDLRQPVFANAFGLHTKTGLSEVLTGGASLDAALANVPQVPYLSVLPCGPAVANPANLVDSEAMKSLVADLRNRFDYVVVDSPPVIPFSDARVLSRFADVVVLVGRYGLTTHRAIARCAQMLDEVQAPPMGVVLNDVDLDSPDYHYYNYGFSKRLNERSKYYTARNPVSFTDPESPDPVGPDPVKKRSAHA